jgi:hypothetical protein
MRRVMPTKAAPRTTVLVSPTALVLSMLHTGSPSRLPIGIARSREDFMQRALRHPPRVAVIERGWLSEIDLRRLALRRSVSSTPRMLLVLGRDQEPTPFERMYFDAVVVAGHVFLRSAKHLQKLVDNVPTEVTHKEPSGPTPSPSAPAPSPLRMVA